MAADLQGVVQLLEASLDAKQHKQAEAALQNEEQHPGFSLKLLQIVASESYPRTSRLASALCFKNFVKRRWADEEGNYKLPQNEVKSIKQELVGLMISVPPAIQAQLGDAVSVIAESDFWERWNTLVDDLVSRLTVSDARINNGVLQVAHSIFRRWRPLFRSDDLFTEINHVLSKFGAPFLTLLQNTDQTIQQSHAQQNDLKNQFITLNLSIKLIFDLSCQDLPPVFEENIQGLSGLLLKYLTYDNSVLHTEDDSEVGVLEEVKCGIFDVLILYVQKYGDVFDAFIGEFVQTSWNLLTSVGLETKYDLLVSRALSFLTSVTRNSHFAATFNNQSTLRQVIEGVILPNVGLRESDIELFEDEPIEFTRRDLEGTDSETRRRAATDFLRQLMNQFDESVTRTVMQYVDIHLQQHSKDQDWRPKDTAVYLFSSIAAKGVVTSAHGVKSVNSRVNIVDFFKTNIAIDLVQDKTNAVLQVDAIKYLYMFRSQMNSEQWREALPLLVRHLGSPNYVVHTYSAIAIERILALNNDKQEPIISRADITPVARDLLQRLFLLATRDSAPEKVQENEFLMRCVMRVLIVLREDVLPMTDFVLTNFVRIIQVIRHNPSNPRFYYYLFEGVGALIRFASPSQPEKLETTLYDPFAQVLQNDVQEFMPYIFQLFAALLEANPSGTLSDYYKGLIGPVLVPSLWESRGNIPALVRLLSSLITRGADEILKHNQVEPILGIFQKLISAKSSESQAFDLLEVVIASFPVLALQPYLAMIFQLVLVRLQNSRTENLTIRFVRLYYFMADRDDKGLGADQCSETLEKVQPGVYTQLYIGVILPDTQKLSRPLDRKIAAMALTKTLSDSTAFAQKYTKGWGYTAEGFAKLMKDPPMPPAADDAILDQDVDDLSFGVGFTQLTTCKKAPTDPHPEVTDVVGWCRKYIVAADQRHAGQIRNFIQTRCSPETQNLLAQYIG